jgi:hypothetical protein
MTATRSNPEEEEECVVEEEEEEEAAMAEEGEEEEEDEDLVCGSWGLRANKALFGRYLFFL